eukprot:scaffold53_cov193-Pinguiococcus_pyrenoidosus.AAC.42
MRGWRRPERSKGGKMRQLERELWRQHYFVTIGFGCTYRSRRITIAKFGYSAQSSQLSIIIDNEDGKEKRQDRDGRELIGLAQHVDSPKAAT